MQSQPINENDDHTEQATVDDGNQNRSVSRRASQGIDTSIPARVVTSRSAYQGAIFSVEERLIAMKAPHGEDVEIQRQVVHHAPSVVMLVHDEHADRYIVEREYRAGSNRFALGLPAGLLDDGERSEQAALRELREETGVEARNPKDVRIERIGDFYPSEGMTDELVSVLLIHLTQWVNTGKQFDTDEYVESRWVSWRELNELPIAASNAVIAIQYEALRRLRSQR